MAAGMILGMALAFGLASLAGIWFGAFEVQVPAMLTGMVGRDGGGHARRARAPRPGAQRPDRRLLWPGRLCSFTYVADSLLRGERTYRR